MDTLTVSAETYAAQFSKCKPGEAVTGTFSGTVGQPDATGNYTIELNAVTKDPTGDEAETAPVEEAPEEMMGGVSPAAKAVMGREEA